MQLLKWGALDQIPQLARDFQKFHLQSLPVSSELGLHEFILCNQIISHSLVFVCDIIV
jgi:hypothetical protein